MRRLIHMLGRLIGRKQGQQQEPEFLGYEAFSQASVPLIKPPLKTVSAVAPRRKAA